MRISIYGDTQNGWSIVYRGKSNENGRFAGTPILGKPHMSYDMIDGMHGIVSSANVLFGCHGGPTRLYIKDQSVTLGLMIASSFSGSLIGSVG